MKKLKVLKSFHVLSNLPVQVFDKNFKLISIYKSDRANILNYNLNYNFKLFDFYKDLNKIKIVTGSFNELYIFYPYESFFILVGPFRCNIVNKSLLQDKLNYFKISLEEQEIIYTYLNNLKLFSLGDVRDIVIHLNYCLTGNLIDPLSKELHKYLYELELKLDESHIDSITSTIYNTDIYLFYYEQKVLEYVKSACTEKLKEMVFNLSNSVIPHSTGDEFRSAKNYSIIIFEKLSNIAIQLGCDIIKTYKIRDILIKELEEAKNFSEVLKIRDSSIVYFTRKIGEVKNLKYSRLVKDIIQFISLNIYNQLKVKDISEHFYLSETSLRNKFKKETNMTLQEFIINKKINESKIMLKSGLSITEIASKLGFSDSAHFSKSFKSLTNITPKQYQIKNANVL